MSSSTANVIWIVIIILVIGYFVLRYFGRRGQLGAGATIRIDVRVTTKQPMEAVYDKLTSPSGLDWIRSPWSLKKAGIMQDGSILTWSLGEVRTIQTPVRADRPRSIGWGSLGLEGRIVIVPRGDGTEISYSGVFPASWTSLKDTALLIFWRSKMSRLASEESQALLARFLR